MKRASALDIIVGLLTPDELENVLKNRRSPTFHKWCMETITTPAFMERLQKATGQENDPGYIAYVLEFLVEKA